MDARVSEAYISEVLDIYEETTVLVIGRDRFGNYIDRDGGQARQLQIRVSPQCSGVSPSFGTHFEYLDRVTTCTGTCTGRFQASITPRQSGPSIVEVFYDADNDRGEEDHIPNSDLVHGAALPVIVRMALNAPIPNAGHVLGGTMLHVPVFGVCDWFDSVWTPAFTCVFEGVGVGVAVGESFVILLTPPLHRY